MLEEVKGYLGADGSEYDSILTPLISAAQIFIINGTRPDVDVTNELYKLALKLLVNHWYENREPIGKADKLAFSLESIFLQLKYCHESSV